MVISSGCGFCLFSNVRQANSQGQVHWIELKFPLTIWEHQLFLCWLSLCLTGDVFFPSLDIHAELDFFFLPSGYL